MLPLMAVGSMLLDPFTLLAVSVFTLAVAQTWAAFLIEACHE
jgi:hypothetical protein